METKNTVTAEEIKENMKDVNVRVAKEYGQIATDVTVTMKSGFTLHTGIATDPENYDEEEDKEYCLKCIKSKIRLILEYELQDKIFKEKNIHKTFKEKNKHKTFNPFQNVLIHVMNDDGNYVWIASIYSHYDAKKNRHYLTNMQWTDDDNDIIPFEGNEDKVGQVELSK